MNREDDEKSREAIATEKKRTEVELLSHQLQKSIPSFYGNEVWQTLIKGTKNLYHGFKAKDRTETLLIRHIVILNNVATECLSRGVNASDPKARAVDLRSGLKAVALIAELIKTLERRRQRNQQHSDEATRLVTLPNSESPSQPEQAKDPGALEVEETAKTGRNENSQAA